MFPLPLQSTSGLTQVGLHPQGVRLLRPSAVPQASSDVFAFPSAACSLEHNFTVDDVNTPKVGPVVFWVILFVFTVASSFFLVWETQECSLKMILGRDLNRDR